MKIIKGFDRLNKYFLCSDAVSFKQNYLALHVILLL